ncbi:MAG TPA: xanthine dehydrogenase family protein, partial [Beijerinckiaceae bacterium]|nr:xanthine dehydrogenase family protein [Beijerinckiaceae bacterium]
MSDLMFDRDMGRVEDEALLRGEGRFVDDIHLPNLLHAAFLRSPHPHAAIGRIDASRARELSGVAAVFTLDDLAGHVAQTELAVALPSPAYRLTLHRPLLARRETVYVGEPIAIVVARSRSIAEDALALVEVDFQPMSAVENCRDALAPGSASAHSKAPHNMVAEFQLGFGDVESAFAGAEHVFREELWLHRGGSHSMECRGCVAQYGAFEDRLTLWSSTQTPGPCRRHLAEILGRDENAIRVVAPDVGGGFGPKLVFYCEEAVVSAAAIMLRAPIKWIEDRHEHFVAATQERDQYWDIEIAVDSGAKIRGVRGALIQEHGAYTARGVNVSYSSATAVSLPYVVPAYRLDIREAVTNKTPVTPVRGAGQPEAVFVMERLLDRVASELGLDRAEVRRRNIVRAEQMPYTTPMRTRGDVNVVLDSGDYLKVMESALSRARWDDFAKRKARAREQGRLIGIGLANYVEGT